MNIVALLMIAWLMIGFPIAMIVLSLRWMAARRKNGYKTSILALVGVALFASSCERVTVEQIVISSDGGISSGGVDMVETPAVVDMKSVTTTNDMSRSTAYDLSTDPDSDLAPMCMPRLSTCTKTSECCTGLTCDTNNDTCCVPGAGPSTAGCDYIRNTGCCNVNIGANAGVTCQNQGGVGICCRNVGGVCATDQDCCLQNTGTMNLCINNICTTP